MILIDAGQRVVPAFREKLSAKTAHGLASLGVTVREGAQATAIDEEGVTIKVGDSEERIDARTVVWAAGVRAAGAAEALAQATGAKADRAGRIEINPDLTLPGHPEISVIGDAASLAYGAEGKPLPGLATVAIQQARHVARAIRGGEPGATKPFRYRDKGALAVVGRGRAVCEIRGLGYSGPPAFLTYLTVHLYYLGGVLGRRLEMINAWVSASFGNLQNRVIEGELPRGGIASPSPRSCRSSAGAPTRSICPRRLA